MPTARCTRAIHASPRELWEVLGDPHHLPRWWPRVSRVEAVEGDAFTEVLKGSSGKIVRADFKLLAREDLHRIVWSQQVEDTPFARVLKSAETEITLAGMSEGGERAELDEVSERGEVGERDAGVELGELADVSAGVSQSTQVTIELRQELQGFRGENALSLRMAGISRFGSPLVRRAAASTLDEALDGLERIVGVAD